MLRNKMALKISDITQKFKKKTTKIELINTVSYSQLFCRGLKFEIFDLNLIFFLNFFCFFFPKEKNKRKNLFCLFGWVWVLFWFGREFKSR